MTLIELRYLVALGQTRHFGRAAELCSVSQPTLSMAVRKLEETLGVLLFERSKSGIRATELGAQIIAQAAQVVARADAISALAQADREQLGGELKLGALFTLGPYLLPPLIPTLGLLAPQVRLSCHEGYSSYLRQQLREGELDAILISQAFSEADIVAQEVYREPLLVVMPPKHALAAKTIIQPQDLQAQPFLVLGEKQCLRQQMLAALALPAMAPAAVELVECSSLETLRHMLALGLGLSILPAAAINSPLYSPQALVARPLQGNPVRTISLAWRASFPRHKAIDALRRAIQMNSWQFTTAHEQEASGLLVENSNW